MQCCTDVRATYRKQQTPQLWIEGRGRVRIILFSEVTVFDYNVSTILSPIVGLFNGYWQNNAEDNAEVDLLPIEVGGGG